MTPGEPLTAAALIGGCDWLAQCPEPHVAALLARSSERSLARADAVYESGGSADRVFVLISGRVGAWRADAASPHDPERGVWYFISDTPFTTMCIENVITGIDYFATMRAMTGATRILVIPKRPFEQLIDDHSPIGIAIARHVARRLQAFTEQSVDFAVLDAYRRVAKYLTHFADAGDEFGPLRQGEMAARLAVSRQTVNAAMSQFRRRGWIAPIGDGRYRLVDRATITQYAGGSSRTGAEVFS